MRNGHLGLLTPGFLSRQVEEWAASGARHGLEYRHPLLDRRVLELALSLPPEQFRRGPTTRYLMRHALDLKAVLPSDVCWNESKSCPARRARAPASLRRPRNSHIPLTVRFHTVTMGTKRFKERKAAGVGSGPSGAETAVPRARGNPRTRAAILPAGLPARPRSAET